MTSFLSCHPTVRFLRDSHGLGKPGSGTGSTISFLIVSGYHQIEGAIVVGRRYKEGRVQLDPPYLNKAR